MVLNIKYKPNKKYIKNIKLKKKLNFLSLNKDLKKIPVPIATRKNNPKFCLNIKIKPQRNPIINNLARSTFLYQKITKDRLPSMVELYNQDQKIEYLLI